MEKVISKNKKEVIFKSKAIARRLNITIPTEEDLKEDGENYYIKLDFTYSKTETPLPIGLTKMLEKKYEK